MIAFLVTLLVACKSATPEPAEVEYLISEHSSGELSAALYASSREIETHELLTLRLVVQSGADASVELPKMTGKWGDFTIFETELHPARLESDARVVRERSYILEPDLPEEYNVSSVTVKATNSQGKIEQVTTDAFKVRVHSVLANGEAQWQDLAPEVQAKDSGNRVLEWGLMIAVMIAVLLVLIYFKKGKRAASVTLESVALVKWEDLQEMVHLNAREKLDVLEKSICSVWWEPVKAECERPIDLAALETLLKQRDSLHPDFIVAVRDFEESQYASTMPSDEQVQELCERFHVLQREVKL